MSIKNQKSMTAAEIRKANKAHRKTIEAEFKKLSIELEKYHLEGFEYVYPPDVELTINGGMFTDIINSNEEFKKVVGQIMTNLEVSMKVADSLLDRNQNLTIQLMKAHVENLRLGKLVQKEITDKK